MGTIVRVQKKNGFSYRAIIREKGNKPITQTFSKKGLASDWIKKVEGSAEIRRAFQKEAHKVTISQMVDNHITHWKGKSRVPLYVLQWWKHKLGTHNAIEVTSDHIRDLLNEYAEGKALRGNGKGKRKRLNKPRSPATVNRAKAALSSAFEYGREHLGLSSNPCRKVKARTENNIRVRFLTDEERNDLFTACKVSPWEKLFLITLLAVTTGGRKGELLGLRWSDIDFKSRTATLPDTKNGTPRILTLPKPAIQELLKFREIGSGLVFASTIKPYIAFDFKKPWAEALRAAQVNDFKFHDLRHTHASYLAQSGATLLEIADALGHMQIQVTMRYAHLCKDSKQKLNDKVFGAI